MKEYFRPNEHLILCPSPDIAEQAASWLNKSARIRQEIAEEGQKPVTGQHLFEHRWRMIVAGQIVDKEGMTQDAQIVGP